MRTLLALTFVMIVVGLTLWAVIACAAPGDPIPGLTAAQKAQFDAGKLVFSRQFTASDGLGPFFNNTACAQCHETPTVGGHAENNGQDIDHERHASRGDQPACDELLSSGGPVFRQATTGPPLPAIPADFAVHIGTRDTPDVFGFGLIDAIPDTAITAHPKRGGRPAILPDGSLGRFGRKATDAHLAGFVRGAFDKEQGVEVPAELSEADLALTVDFVSFLAPPAPNSHPDVIGKFLFGAIGCADCHTPAFTTSSPVAALNHKTVHLYSDLLLHDLGPGSTDMCKGVAATNEIRTEPLMSIAGRERFLHDARCPTLDCAIAAHGGQAQFAADNFASLPRVFQKHVLAFVEGL